MKEEDREFLEHMKTGPASSYGLNPEVDRLLCIIDGLEAEVKEAVGSKKDSLEDALELIEDLRGYCREAWDWKYKDYWDEETEKVRAALTKGASHG